MFTTTDDGRTMDGSRLDGYPISSPCEPNGSGELKIIKVNLMTEHGQSKYLILCMFFGHLFLKMGGGDYRQWSLY